jgi:hypothetical protein
MTIWMLIQGTIPDTTVTQSLTSGWVATVNGLASVLISLAVLSLALVVVPAAWHFRKSYKQVNTLVERVQAEIIPIAQHAKSIADNLNYITTAIREDTRVIHTTVTDANKRLVRGMDAVERRMRELNALATVVQHEAESAFISTASTVRGVRTGAEALRSVLERDLEPRPAADDGAPQAIDDEEDFDGDDDETENGDRRADADEQRPRIRSRENDRV